MSRPTTPDRNSPSPPVLSTARRVFTLPTRLSSQPNSTIFMNSNDAGETFLTLPSVKVISFNPVIARPASSRSDTSSGSQQEDVLPWSTPTESLKAEGLLKIYRTPTTGTVFLECNGFRKPILQRTQCWMVDNNNTKVVLKFEGYYRIEILPDSECAQYDELKATLSKLCQFEKTSCPFRPGYRSETGEPATPSRRQSLMTPRAKKWRHNGIWEPEDEERRAEFQEKNKRQTEQLKQGRRQSLQAKISERWNPSKLTSSASRSDASRRYSTLDASQTPSVTLMPAPTPETVRTSRSLSSRVEAARRLSEQLTQAVLPSRASQAAQEMVEDSSAASETSATGEIVMPQIVIDGDADFANNSLPPLSTDGETVSLNSNADSFYSFDDDLTIEPEPLLLSPGGFSLHSHSSSNGTIVPPTPREADDMPWTPMIAGSQHGDDITSNASNHSSDEIELVTPIAQALRRRKIPLIYPPDKIPTSYSTEGAPAKQIVIRSSPKTIPEVVIQKTYNLLLSPSFSLVALLMSIAQRLLTKTNTKGHRRKRSVPGEWEQASEDETEYEDALEVDDFDHPVSGFSSRENLASKSRESLLLSKQSSHASDSLRRRDQWSVD